MGLCQACKKYFPDGKDVCPNCNSKVVRTQKGGMAIVLGLLAVIAVFGFYASSSGDGGKAVRAPQINPERTVEGTDLLIAYLKNELAADSAYKGRYLDINGVASDARNDASGRPVLAMQDIGDGRGIICRITPESLSVAAKGTFPAIAKVSGTVTGFLQGTQIVMVEPCTVISLTADKPE